MTNEFNDVVQTVKSFQVSEKPWRFGAHAIRISFHDA
jgi:hypothetical protein|tara:strand:+ start:183 stop:293 length:111 start_codon:yes stop_codon:yes gene_type:complete